MRYETPVTKIDYTNPDKITVYDDKNNTYECDLVVVAVPLSILKRNHIKFVPELPKEKQISLEALSIESGAKLIMKFSETFWPKDLRNTIQDDLFNYIWSPSNVRQSPTSHILTALITGKAAIEVALMKDEDLKKEIFKRLTKFGVTQKKVKELFIEYKLINWVLEPYIRGVYSYPALNLDGQKYRNIMMKPIDKKIFFAGEAFNKENYSTIGSALQSGLRAAQQIKRFYHKTNEVRVKKGIQEIKQEIKKPSDPADDYKDVRIVLDYRTVKAMERSLFTKNLKENLLTRSKL